MNGRNGTAPEALLEIKPLGAETRSTIGTTKTVGTAGIVSVMVKVTAVSGDAPTLDIKVQDGDTDPPTTDRKTWPQITAVGEYQAYFRITKRCVRYASTIAGVNPSFTYSVYVTA